MAISGALSFLFACVFLIICTSADEVSTGGKVLTCSGSESWDCLGDDHRVVKKDSSEDAGEGVEIGESNDIGGVAGDDGKNVLLGQTPRTARTLDITDEEEDKHLAEIVARTIRHPRKIWMALLSGIVLKMASLVPLILSKLALIGTVSLLASKLSLLIVTMMVMRHMLSGEVKMPGYGGELGGYGGHQQGDYHHGAASGMVGYNNVQPHRRWAYYRTGGRELGGGADGAK